MCTTKIKPPNPERKRRLTWLGRLLTALGIVEVVEDGPSCRRCPLGGVITFERRGQAFVPRGAGLN